jgi:hypothetical protein
MSQYRNLFGGAGLRTILRRLRNISRFVIAVRPTWPGQVPKPCCEPDHFGGEYKDRNGTPGSLSEPDAFVTAAASIHAGASLLIVN